MISSGSIEERTIKEYEMLYEFLCFSGNFDPDMAIAVTNFKVWMALYVLDLPCFPAIIYES